MKRRKQPAAPKQITPGPKYAGVYRAAAENIRSHGWCHQGGIDRQGRICLLIAIVGAAKGRLTEDQSTITPALHVARHLDPNARPGSAYALIAYNDAPERTEAEVLELLDRLAA